MCRISRVVVSISENIGGEYVEGSSERSLKRNGFKNGRVGIGWILVINGVKGLLVMFYVEERLDKIRNGTRLLDLVIWKLWK